MKTRFLALFILLANASMFAQTTFTVSANGGWLNTNITKNAGATLYVSASGSATVWPTVSNDCYWTDPAGLGRPTNGCTNCACPNCPVISLIGRLGTGGTPFYIGTNGIIDGSGSGQLFLRVNDQTSNYADNQGSFSVIVSTICSPGMVVPNGTPWTEESLQFENGKMAVFPNPASEGFTLHFDLNQASEVTVNLLDMEGKLVEKVIQDKMDIGGYDFTTRVPEKYNAAFLLVQTIINGETQVQKLLVIK